MKWQNSKELIAQGGCWEQTLPTKNNLNPAVEVSAEDQTNQDLDYFWLAMFVPDNLLERLIRVLLNFAISCDDFETRF